MSYETKERLFNLFHLTHLSLKTNENLLVETSNHLSVVDPEIIGEVQKTLTEIKESYLYVMDTLQTELDRLQQESSEQNPIIDQILEMTHQTLKDRLEEAFSKKESSTISVNVEVDSSTTFH